MIKTSDNMRRAGLFFSPQQRQEAIGSFVNSITEAQIVILAESDHNNLVSLKAHLDSTNIIWANETLNIERLPQVIQGYIEQVEVNEAVKAVYFILLNQPDLLHLPREMNNLLGLKPCYVIQAFDITSIEPARLNTLLEGFEQVVINGRIETNPYFIPPEVSTEIARFNGRMQILEQISLENRQKEKQLSLNHKILSNIKEVTVVVDLNGHIIFWNRAAELMFGICEADALGKHFSYVYNYDFIHTQENRQAALSQIFAGNDWNTRLVIHKRDGTSKEFSVWSSLVGSTEKPRGVLSILYDITQELELETTLADITKTLQLLADHTRDLVALHQPDGTYLYVSPAFTTYLGYSPESLLGTNPYDLVHPEDIERIRNQSHAQALRGESNIRIDSRLRHREGHYIWYEIFTQPILDDKNNVIALATSSRDISRQYEAQKQIRARNEQIKQMSSRLVQVEDQERQRIAKEIHDRLGQQLSLASIHLNLLKNEVPEGLHSKLREIERYLENLSKSTRVIMNDLYPTALGEWGLAYAVRDYAERLFANLNIRVIYELDNTDARMPSYMERLLYRIAQEALVNIIKHADAGTVTIRLSIDQDKCMMVISDDGRGFDVEAVAPDRRGLQIIKERVMVIGAEFELQTGIGEGTTLKIYKPVMGSS